MAQVLVSGTLPQGITAGQLTGERRHRLLGDLPSDYRFETELEPHMRKADGYVFLPDADPLLAISVLVAKRIEPARYWDKPVVFVEEPGRRHPIASLFEDLSARGLAKEKPHEVFTIAKGLDGVPAALGKVKEVAHRHQAGNDNPGANRALENLDNGQAMPDDMIAVYCSASTTKPADLALGAETGHEIAHRGWGVTYGGANVSTMGAVAEAARNLDGFVLGVTTHAVWQKNRELDANNHNIPMSKLELVDDIYVRMHKMFMPQPGKPVKAVMVLPGGAGSTQETLAMLQMRRAEPVMNAVPLVLINDKGAWNELAKSAEQLGLKAGRDYHMFDTVKEAMPFLDRQVAALNADPNWPGHGNSPGPGPAGSADGQPHHGRPAHRRHGSAHETTVAHPHHGSAGAGQRPNRRFGT